MDFRDTLMQFATRASSMKDVLSTEEATKTALILPFFQSLGYDVFNPLEFVPEYTADVGIKKGEKVDYAIVLNDAPVILIEAKGCGESLEKHDSQLFRYFGTSPAKFGILTNGFVYKFYSDLDEPNKMDLIPFLTFDILDLNDSIINEIRRFSKEKLDIDAAVNAASELKYSNQIKQLLLQQRTTPDVAFVNYILGEVYTGRRTQQVVEKFTGLIKRAYNSFLNDLINTTLKSAMQSHDEDEVVSNVENVSTDENADAISEETARIVTTPEELQLYATVKAILHDVIPPSDISYKDTASYFNILYANNARKWICRLVVSDSRCTLILPGDDRKEERIRFENIDDIYQFSDKLIASAKRFIN